MSEHAEQVLLFQRAALHEARYPELRLLHAIPNGSHKSRATARRFKAEGLKSGVPDVHLPVPRRGFASLYIEMKRLKPRATKTKGLRLDPTKPTPEQLEWIDRLRAAGNAVEICWTAEEAWSRIVEYLDAAA